MATYDREEMWPQYQPETEKIKENKMNFNEARNLEGQKNAKGYQEGVSMQGTITALIDPQRIFTTNGKPTQRIQLTDAMGESQKVKVFLGNGPDILLSDINTMQSFTDLAMNRYKGAITYMAFWDNMHPPQGQSPATQLNAATQEIIDRHIHPQQTAAGAIQDHMAGPAPAINAAPAAIPQQAYNLPTQTPPPTQQDYEVKERKKVLGMCFTNLLAGRLAAICPTEMEKDLGAIAALWRLSAICIDGTGQVEGPNI